MNRIVLLLITLNVFILSSCNSDSTKPEGPALISGIAKNANNEIVEGAKIVFGYSLEEVTRPMTTLRLDLPEASNVKIWITRYAQTDTIRVLLDEIMDQGSHSVVWDGKNDMGLHVYSYSYNFHLKTDAEERVIKFVYFADYSNVTGSNVQNFEACTTTNSAGEYSFPLENLLMFKDSAPMDYTDENGNVTEDGLQFSQYLKVWALHPDHEATFVDSIFVREDKSLKVNLDFAD